MSQKDLVVSLFKGLKKIQKDFDEILNPKPCTHQKTVCLNEEGNAGVFCADCGECITREA